MNSTRLAMAIALTAALVCSAPAANADPQRGAYLFRAAGCGGCHIDAKAGGKAPAGGGALETPFGTFFGPNITPDPDHGLGRWSKEDFKRALRQGLSPQGAPYYPAFPYTSFTFMADADIDDLWSYLRSLPAVARPDKAHELSFPFNLRPLMRAWRWLFFETTVFEPNDSRDQAWNRGAYLTKAVGHCGECHSPRGLFGQVDESLVLAGNPQGPEGKSVPNVTPHATEGIGAWSVDDIATYLTFGMTPKGDFADGSMAEVIRRSTQYLSDGDRSAIALYLKGIEALPRAF